VDPEHLRPCLRVREGHLEDALEPPGVYQRPVDQVGAVRRADPAVVVPAGGQRVDLVEEDDGRGPGGGAQRRR
jgi:hypothetical protein